MKVSVQASNCEVARSLATGAFDYTDATSTSSGTLDFVTGMASGTFNDPNATPATGSFVGGRR